MDKQQNFPKGRGGEQVPGQGGRGSFPRGKYFPGFFTAGCKIDGNGESNDSASALSPGTYYLEFYFESTPVLKVLDSPISGRNYCINRNPLGRRLINELQIAKKARGHLPPPPPPRSPPLAPSPPPPGTDRKG